MALRLSQNGIKINQSDFWKNFGLEQNKYRGSTLGWNFPKTILWSWLITTIIRILIFVELITWPSRDTIQRGFPMFWFCSGFGIQKFFEILNRFILWTCSTVDLASILESLSFYPNQPMTLSFIEFNLDQIIDHRHICLDPTRCRRDFGPLWAV